MKFVNVSDVQLVWNAFWFMRKNYGFRYAAKWTLRGIKGWNI